MADTLRDSIKARNLAHWQGLADRAANHCRLCNAPLDPGPEVPGPYNHPPDMCATCIDINGVLYRRDYWLRLEREDAARRKAMGLGPENTP